MELEEFRVDVRDRFWRLCCCFEGFDVDVDLVFC